MDLGHYILEGKKIKKVDDILVWGKFFEGKGKIVKQDTISCGVWPFRMNFFISTVFLGLDHRWGDGGPPLLFESMVFKGKLGEDYEQDRYSFYEQAEEGHKKLVEKYSKWRWLLWLKSLKLKGPKALERQRSHFWEKTWKKKVGIDWRTWADQALRTVPSAVMARKSKRRTLAGWFSAAGAKLRFIASRKRK